MKKYLLALIIFFEVGNTYAYPVPHEFPPFKIADGFYYVGTDDLASYLVVTPEGNILINSNFNANVPMLRKSIAELGFNYADTKILLVSHAHPDHAEGSQLIKAKTHAQYMVMDGDVSVVESGGKTDFQYGSDESMHYPATQVDRILHDGDEVSLGGVTLTAHLTPGHTKGCTSWTMTVSDQGVTHHLIIVGSLSVNPGYQLVNNPNYPNIADDYRDAIKTLEALPVDIFLGSHAIHFSLHEKYQAFLAGKANPFLDAKGYQDYIAVQKAAFYAEYERQKVANHALDIRTSA